jgi:hypothetical protein
MFASSVFARGPICEINVLWRLEDSIEIRQQAAEKIRQIYSILL